MTTDSKAVCGGGEADLLTFLDGLAENAAPDQRKPLNPILIGMNASAHADRIRSTALASTAGAGAGDHEPDLIRMLSDDNARMRKAGTALSEAALYVVREYDGCHRLSLAVADWAKAIADEGGRGERHAAPAVPASPRSGAGEKVDQALLRELSDLADWLERDSSENDADNIRAAVSALSQGGGAGRSEKGEGEEEGRVPSGTGSHPTGEAATASSSPSDIDPSRGWIPYEHKDYDPRPDVDWTGYSHEEASSGPAIACEDYTGEPLFLVWWSDFGQGVSRITAWRPLPAELAPPAPDIVAQAIKARRAKTQGGFVEDESAVHAVDAPCHWGGGNDIIWCSTCGAEYAYAKGEERPPCPRSPAPAQSPSTSDREG